MTLGQRNVFSVMVRVGNGGGIADNERRRRDGGEKPYLA
jgi:hypothetical protein